MEVMYKLPLKDGKSCQTTMWVEPTSLKHKLNALPIAKLPTDNSSANFRY